MIEVMIEQLAAELGMDPLELRRKNFIPKEDFPAEVAVGIVYDSGDYHGTLDKLLENLDLDGFRREQAELREQGYRGIGFSTYMEICGLAPSRVVGPSGVGMQGGFWESAIVRVHPTGSVTVFTGTSPHGQGHETASPRSSPTGSGSTPEQVEVIHGDTGHRARGPGHLRLALARGRRRGRRPRDDKVADKAKRIVAHLLEAAPEDIELRDGKFQVRGSPDKGMTLAEVAGAAYIAREPRRGHGAGARGDGVLRPGELRLPVRRARVRGRRRRGDRARSRSCATWRSTTAGRRSTRCSSTARCTAASCTRSARRSTSRSSTTRTASS